MRLIDPRPDESEHRRALAEEAGIDVGQVRAAESGAHGGPDCLDELAIAQAAEGSATPAAIAHLSSCAYCRRQLIGLRSLLAATPVAREVGAPGPARRRAVAWVGLPLAAAAAAVLLLVLIPRDSGPADAGADRFRDEAFPGGAAAPSLIEPRDSLPGYPAALVWSTVAGASEYRATIFDEEGAVLWTSETADTTAALPRDLPFTGRDVYWWRVEARVDFDRWIASSITAFTPGARR